MLWSLLGGSVGAGLAGGPPICGGPYWGVVWERDSLEVLKYVVVLTGG